MADATDEVGRLRAENEFLRTENQRERIVPYSGQWWLAGAARSLIARIDYIMANGGGQRSLSELLQPAAGMSPEVAAVRNALAQIDREKSGGRPNE